MLILTNFPRFPENWTSRSGSTGKGMLLKSAWDFLKHSPGADLVIINCDVGLTLKLAALYLLFPWRKRPVLVNDIVLRKPLTAKARLVAPIKRFLFTRHDHYTLYFRNVEGYAKYFGIGRDPSAVSYLPFKPNIRYRQEYQVSADGDYILCFGRSERDYDTFFAAMEKLPDLPAAIPPPDPAAYREHAGRFTRRVDQVPSNVRILEDDGSSESLVRILERAKLVVLPVVKTSIAPSAIGTYLNAMLMGKCVILTHGVATVDVLVNGEAILVEPEDPTALAAAIRRAWDDRELRERTAAAGRKYAESCGGEADLRQRILERALERLGPRVEASEEATAR